MIPATDVDVCNLALDKIGQQPITSLTSTESVAAEVCKRWYDQTRREVLRAFIFNFSKKLDVLSYDADKTPAFGYDKAFALPTKFLRLLAIGDISINADTPPELYELSEGYLFTNYGDETNTEIKISMVVDEGNVGKFDPLFVKLLYLQLASNIAFKFTLKTALKNDLKNELQLAVSSAIAVNGQEKPPRRVERSKWVRSFKGGSVDNTRYI